MIKTIGSKKILSLLPEIKVDDGFMLTFMDEVLVSDATDIDRILQQSVKRSPCKIEPAACYALLSYPVLG